MKWLKQIINTLLIITFSTSLILLYPNQVKAFSLGKAIGNVFDIMANPSTAGLKVAQSLFLDGEKTKQDLGVWGELGFDVVKTGIESLGDSLRDRIYKRNINKLTSWIKDESNPIEDWETNLTNAGKMAGGEFLNNLLSLQTGREINLCGPLGFEDQDRALANLTLSLGPKPDQLEQPVGCKINDAYKNLEGFYNDFTGGCKEIDGDTEVCSESPWDTWLKITVNPKFTYQGAYLTLLDQKLINEQTAIDAKSLEMQSGKGFLGMKRCVVWSGLEGVKIDLSDSPTILDKELSETDRGKIRAILIAMPVQTDPEMQRIMANASRYPEENLPLLGFKCDEYKTKTPGSLAADLAANIIYGDVQQQANRAGSSLLKDAITRITDSLVFRFVDKGLFGLGQQEESPMEDFYITSREEWLNLQSGEKILDENLVSNYEQALLDIDGESIRRLDAVDDIINAKIQGTEVYRQQLGTYKGYADFTNCATNVCLDNEYRRCDALYGKDQITIEELDKYKANPTNPEILTLLKNRDYDAACLNQLRQASLVSECASSCNQCEVVVEIRDKSALKNTYIKCPQEDYLTDNLSQAKNTCQNKCLYNTHKRPPVNNPDSEPSAYYASACLKPDSSYFNCLETRWTFCTEQNPEVKDAREELNEFNKFTFFRTEYQKLANEAIKELDKNISQLLQNQEALISAYWDDYPPDKKTYQGIEELTAEVLNLQGTDNTALLSSIKTEYDRATGLVNNILNKINELLSAKFTYDNKDYSYENLAKWADPDFLTEKRAELIAAPDPKNNNPGGKYYNYLFKGKQILDGETCKNYEWGSSSNKYSYQCADYQTKMENKNACIPYPDGKGEAAYARVGDNKNLYCEITRKPDDWIQSVYKRENTNFPSEKCGWQTAARHYSIKKL